MSDGESDGRPCARPREVPLAGYSDRLSLRGGERIAFQVSTTSPGRAIRTRLARSISADPNPDGPGIVETPCDERFPPRSFEGRHQPIRAGSYARSERPVDLDDAVVALDVLAWPTLHRDGSRCLLSVGELALELDADARFAARSGGAIARLETPAVLRRWARLRVVLDRGAGTLSIRASSPPSGGTVDGREATVATARRRRVQGGPRGR